MSETVQTLATDAYLSVALPVNDLEQDFTYNGSNQVTKIRVIYRGQLVTGEVISGIIYEQNITWSGANVSKISRWTPVDFVTNAFISRWKTDNPGTSASNQITLPLESSGTYDMEVAWGDGTFSTITAYDDPEVTHTYAVAGTYEVSIRGTCEGWRFNFTAPSYTGDARKFIELSQWGILKLGNSNAYFKGCYNLDVTATDIPDLTGTTDLTSMFEGCFPTTTIANIGSWDISEVTTAAYMFEAIALTTENYNSLLIGWAAQTVQSGVAFGAGSSVSSGLGTVARASLISDDSWTISDGD